MSIVTAKDELVLLLFPALSLCLAEIEWTPAINAVEVIVAVFAEQTAEPRTVEPSRSSTVRVFSQVMLNVGVVSLVKLSVLEVPVSEAACKSGIPVAVGAELSMLIDSARLSPEFRIGEEALFILIEKSGAMNEVLDFLQ